MSKDIILSKMQYSKYSKISVTASNTYLKQKLYKEKDSQTEVLHAVCVCACMCAWIWTLQIEKTKLYATFNSQPSHTLILSLLKAYKQQQKTSKLHVLL